MKLKICGITDAEQYQELSEAGADYLGCIFVEESPRFIGDEGQRKELLDVVREHSANTRGVAVVRDASHDTVEELVETEGFSVVQLHGSEPPEFLQQLRKQYPELIVIKAIPVDDIFPREVELYRSNDFFLFDTLSSAGGGSGELFNWSVLDEGDISKPFFLAGGISLGSLHLLKEFLRSARSFKDQFYALDINSRFEVSPGVKNIELCKAMIEEIKQWD